jgi:hypothetical protein
MPRLLLTLFLFFLFHTEKGFSQSKKREDGKPQVPVFINYSAALKAAPDSVISFVATCFKLKGIELVDSSTMRELSRAEMGAVMQEYKKRNEPQPDFKEMSRKFRTAVNLVNLSIYRNFLIPGAPVDSIKWSVTAMPLNFEKLPRGGRFYPAETATDNLYSALKATTDNIISFLGRKEEENP